MTKTQIFLQNFCHGQICCPKTLESRKKPAENKQTAKAVCYLSRYSYSTVYPLSDVMGGWGIWETVNGEQKLTTECIENVIMMVPFSAVVMWTFGEKIGNGWKKILWQSGKIAFCFSISIEMLQLLLRLGTFQLSDIFYNTVGGVLGGLVYYVAMKARKHL